MRNMHGRFFLLHIFIIFNTFVKLSLSRVFQFIKGSAIICDEGMFLQELFVRKEVLYICFPSRVRAPDAEDGPAKESTFQTNSTKLTEISEKGKPCESAGRKATGPKA